MMPVGHVFCEAPWGRRDYHIRHVEDVTYGSQKGGDAIHQ